MPAFRKNPRFRAEMERTPAFRAEIHAQVEAQVKPKVEQMARQARAPWMPRGGPQIVVESNADGVTVANTDYGAHLQEYGSKNNPPHAPLRRGARAAGLRLTDQ